MSSPTASDYAIRLHGVGKMYRLYRRPADKFLDAFGIRTLVPWRRERCQEFWALRDFHLEIRRGERVGIIGRNGAGKSTLLKIIAGTVAVTEGELNVGGRIQALLELGTGFHPEFTGRQNIRASLAYQGFSPSRIRELEEDIVDFAEIEEFIEQPVKTYSAGMYARLAFATATAIEPDILIIDEVLGAGDAYFAGKCVERMTALTAGCGATVLFVSHDLASVQQLCQRVVWMNRGRCVFDGDPLTAIKGYSAAVRAEEETRLRARDLRVLKKQAVLLDRLEDIYDRWLFHFIPASGPMHRRNHIYRLRLFVGPNEVGTIDVGSAMDNSSEHLHYLMDTPGFMDWGTARRDAHGACREFGSLGGKYGHAPFEFAIPKSQGGNDVRLEILCQADEPMAIEIFDGKGYVRLGVIGPQPVAPFDIRFSPQSVLGRNLSAPAALTAEPSTPALPVGPELPVQVSSSEYGAGGARIRAVRMLDAGGNEKRVFKVGEPMQIVFDFEAFERLVNPVFVFTVYLADGRCATQWIVSSRTLGASSFEGRGEVVFSVPKLLLGRSAYVASAGIFKYLRTDGLEAESYHVLDRCIHFQIVQEEEDRSERGLCLQPFEARLR